PPSPSRSTMSWPGMVGAWDGWKRSFMNSKARPASSISANEPSGRFQSRLLATLYPIKTVTRTGRHENAACGRREEGFQNLARNDDVADELLVAGFLEQERLLVALFGICALEEDDEEFHLRADG